LGTADSDSTDRSSRGRATCCRSAGPAVMADTETLGHSQQRVAHRSGSQFSAGGREPRGQRVMGAIDAGARQAARRLTCIMTAARVTNTRDDRRSDRRYGTGEQGRRVRAANHRGRRNDTGRCRGRGSRGIPSVAGTGDS
jgi:hypothetical protein